MQLDPHVEKTLPQGAAGHGYAFRPVSERDLPMIERWLCAEHVARWWPDASRQLAAIARHNDPDPANLRAVRAYEKAGFKKLEDRTIVDGPVVLMARDR